MTDPKRLRDLERDPALAAALDAANDDRAPQGTEERMLASLGVAPIGAGGGGTAATTKAVATKTFAKVALVKWLAVSAVVAAAATGGMLAAPSPFAAPSAVDAPSVIPASMPSKAPPPVDVIASAESPPVVVVPAPPAPPAPRPVVMPSASAAPPSSTSSTLAEELALLAEANAAVRARDPAAATSALDRYDARFAHGSLVTEAEALRIETIALTDAPRARKLARPFIAAHPSSPVTRRLRRIAEEEP